ncbi:exo-alpha-sialidase [bacterium]|nr:exo-alpha-sialidase [bacterium]
MHKTYTILICLTLLIILIGCSKDASPLAPSMTNGVSPEFNPQLAVSDYAPSGIISGGMSALGLYQAHINTDTLSGELIPFRTSALTDSLEIVDITNFLTMAPCVDCVKLDSIGLDAKGNISLRIGIKHPFDAPDLEGEISGANRADLHIFNIEGTIIGDSGLPFEFTELGETIDSFRLINADGYSKYLDQTLETVFPSTATIHPYILHFDDYTLGNFDPASATGFSDVITPTGNLVMAMGADYDFKNYVFSYPSGGNLDFIFAVGCSFGVSVESWEGRLEPEYRIPQFNKKAASEIDVRVTDWSFIAGDTESTVSIEVDVMDINHGVAVGEALDEMAHDSSVAQIALDIPGFLLEQFSATDPEPKNTIDHVRTDPYIFEITLTNTAGGTQAAYPALLKVTDSYPPASNTHPYLTGMDGLARIEPGASSTFDSLFVIDEFATYLAFILAEPGAEPTCQITTDPSPAEVEQGTAIEFDASGSIDDGIIETYEWDFDYDDVTFNSEASGAVISRFICVPGTHTVAVKLTDDELDSSICTVDVTITADDGAIEGFAADQKILGATSLEPFILNTSNRAIAAWKNNLYIVMNSNLPTDASENIFFMRSTDLGITWETPIQLTSYPAADEAWAREANLAIGKNTGDIFIQFQSDWKSYDATGNYKYDVFFTMSSDEGVTFTGPVQVNDDSPGASDQLAGSIAVDDSTSPSIIYIAYENREDANDFNIFSATALSNDTSTWAITQIDNDTVLKSMHPAIYVNPTDSSVNVAWVDPVNLGGTGQILFDRSIDNAATWGDDISIFTVSSNNGPFETCLAIAPSSGIPGVIWRDVDTGDSTCFHRFAIAESADGATWTAPVNLTDGGTKYCWSGTLDVSSDGRWFAVLEQDITHDTDWKAMFTESSDGITWTTPVQVDDENKVFGLSMVLDDCNTVHVIWGDVREDGVNNELFYDFGS